MLQIIRPILLAETGAVTPSLADLLQKPFFASVKINTADLPQPVLPPYHCLYPLYFPFLIKSYFLTHFEESLFFPLHLQILFSTPFFIIGIFSS